MPQIKISIWIAQNRNFDLGQILNLGHNIYFVIILNVARAIIPFLFILLIMLVSFAHAFLLLLVPKEVYSFDEPPPTDGDPNNPWHLTSSYYQVQNDGTLSSNHR